MEEHRKEFHCDVKEEGSSAVSLLAKETGFSKQKIKQAMQKGAVWLTDNTGTHRLRRHSKKLLIDSVLHFYFDPLVLYEVVSDAILISDETDYSVWYKPRGMLSQGSKWGDHNAINRWVERNLEPQRPVFIVHRLDRYASGLILLAHKKKAAAALSDLFQKKHIKKQYTAIVHGAFPEGKTTFSSEVDGKHAVTHANLLQYDEKNNISLLQVDIETGRKHQIRYHLSNAGFAIVGDRLFGEKKTKLDLQLTAYKLSFVSPFDNDKKEYRLEEKYLPDLNNLKNME